jgi:hypothetical protein
MGPGPQSKASDHGRAPPAGEIQVSGKQAIQLREGLWGQMDLGPNLCSVPLLAVEISESLRRSFHWTCTVCLLYAGHRFTALCGYMVSSTHRCSDTRGGMSLGSQSSSKLYLDSWGSESRV